MTGPHLTPEREAEIRAEYAGEPDFTSEEVVCDLLAALDAERKKTAAAEAERDRAEERLREVAALLRIPDGARYLNDVRARAEVVARAEAGGET